MACPEFEDRLLEYDALDTVERRELEDHLSACAPCREWLAALRSVDAELDRVLSQVEAPSRVGTAVLAAVRRPSRWPEILDLTGWAAVLVITAALILTIVPLPPLNWWWIAPSAVFFAVSAWVGLRLVSTPD